MRSARLAPLLAGRATLVLGPSGAGKSTLVNLLVADAKAQIGEISQALNTGRHTTTATQWYWLDAARTSALIDSPGFQEFGLRHIDAAAASPALMPDIGAPRERMPLLQLHAPARARLRRARGAASAARSRESRYRIYREIFDELRRLTERRRRQPMRLASDSSASSSIQRTTERQTSATTLRRWPSCGGDAGRRALRRGRAAAARRPRRSWRGRA